MSQTEPELELSVPKVHSETAEPASQFEKRKADHIRYSLDSQNEALGASGFDRVELIHEALPEIDFSEVSLKTQSLGLELSTPFLVSSMTAGHMGSLDLNRRLAKACAEKGWLMGVGSQRRELYDSSASNEWKEIRRENPKVKMLGNLGLSQLIQTPVDEVERLVDALEATAMIIHTNPLQECMQPEGTPQFRGGLKALKNLAKTLPVPVILKETGCGFSESTVEKLKDSGIAALDISGFGGTHWGRIEGARNTVDPLRQKASVSFKDWGISTVDSLANAVKAQPPFEVWASGGVRTGLNAALLLSMGARVIGLAKPILSAAVEGEDALLLQMEQMEYELKTALFLTGCAVIKDFQTRQVWKWRKDV